MTKISIIIPVYNAEEYLEECLESIITQDLDDIEIICIDDGSSDKSPQILKYYAEKDLRIINIKQVNSGVSKARNLGMEKATGQYILFVDADDFLARNSLKHLFDCAEESNLDILVFGYNHLVNDKISETAFINIWKDSFPSVPFKFEFDNSFLLNGSIWNKLISREIINKSKVSFPENVSYAEDTIFCFQIYPYVHKVQIILDRIYFYRNRGDSSLSCNNDVFNILYGLFPKFMESIPKEHILTAMDYWCNFFTWNIIKKKSGLTYEHIEIIRKFLRNFENINEKDLLKLTHYQRLAKELQELK